MKQAHIEQAEKHGWKTDTYTVGFTNSKRRKIVMTKGPLRLWEHDNGWTVAHLHRGLYSDHRHYVSLETALMNEDQRVIHRKPLT